MQMIRGRLTLSAFEIIYRLNTMSKKLSTTLDMSKKVEIFRSFMSVFSLPGLCLSSASTMLLCSGKRRAMSTRT